jgi:hypothetical protein
VIKGKKDKDKDLPVTDFCRISKQGLWTENLFSFANVVFLAAAAAAVAALAAVTMALLLPPLLLLLL